MSTLFSHFFEKINQIAPLESDFTEVLESIAVKPKTLYYYGKMPENVVKDGVSRRPKTVAIVGSRHSTKYGEEVAYRLGYELGRRGVVVVSGLAFGIDSVGHRGCLDAGGVTVAVMGTRIDKIYPKAHTALAREIIEKGGAVMSEYPVLDALGCSDAPMAPGEYLGENGERGQDFKGSFLHRNRLIAGLSDAVVIVEAAERSGSLNTATHALAQGREVFAVPGNITNPYSRGCNKLISQGAFPYMEPDDVLSVLFPEEFMKKQKKLKQMDLLGDTDAETAVLKAMAAGVRNGNDIMKRTLLPPEAFSQTIMMLEIKGRVRALTMNNWSLM